MKTRRATTAVAGILAAGVLAVPTTGEAEVGRADEASTFECYGNHYGAPRAIPQLEKKQRVVKRLQAHPEGPGYTVERVRATQLGVIALVSGDVEKAERRLDGVRHVVSWTDHYLSDFPPSMRMSVVITDLVEPVLKDVRRQVRQLGSRKGIGQYAYWSQGAAIVLTWKAPVPKKVLALDGVRGSGAEVRVLARPYSTADVRRAQHRLQDYLDEQGIDWSFMSGCSSEQGLELGVPNDPAEIGVSQEDLDGAAGMPVEVTEGYVGF